MRRRHVFTAILMVLLLAGVPVANAAGSRIPRSGDAPARFMVPQLDGTPVMVENKGTGLAWTAWAIRAAGEFDIAISKRDASGIWSPPEFIGEYNRLNEVDPALAIDAYGTVYLAFAVREMGRIFVSVLPEGAPGWSPPMPLSGSEERALSPTLMVVGDYLILGYWSGGRVVLSSFPVVVHKTAGVQDGPDILPPPGAEGPQSQPPHRVPPSR